MSGGGARGGGAGESSRETLHPSTVLHLMNLCAGGKCEHEVASAAAIAAAAAQRAEEEADLAPVIASIPPIEGFTWQQVNACMATVKAAIAARTLDLWLPLGRAIEDRPLSHVITRCGAWCEVRGGLTTAQRKEIDEFDDLCRRTSKDFASSLM